MKLSNRQKVALTAGIFTVALGGLGTLNFFKFRERGQVFAEMEKLDRDEQIAREKIRRIPELLESRSKLVATIDRYAQILPLEESVQQDAFVDLIDNYRKDTKILIQKAEYIRPREEKAADAKEPFIRHRYRFKLLGTFPDFLAFVSKIENHTRFVKIDAITIKPQGAPENLPDGGSSQADRDLLEKASNPVKEIELTVSTYTYYKGDQRTQQS